MEFLLLAVAILPIYRLIKGPTVWDRVVGLSSSVTKSAIFLSILGLVEHMDYLIYVSIVMILLSLGTVAVLSHFLEE